MARSDAVWGIDIGQCALKALRCRPHEDARQITADAFDYIEYPKILSQPDVDPAELVRDALKQFLSRNSVRGDRVVVSVSGQSGLARFIKLPPVESKKIPDIVKYEARQQIPFALDDVVWDYQTMVGGSVVEGFAMETEVGLFAMKRDQVYRALRPFTEAGIEVDIVQLTPLALYNFVAFDQMENLPPPDEYDAENPPESVVLISLGTDTTDLVVTNGFKVWQRNIPIGGNHFTKALTKELKLTFASAEHLKRNATQAEDPKALFQAMRPVFNDLLTEVQRSIGFFTNLDRRAKIGRALALGNAMKLPGLQRYLAQNLGFELGKLDAFRGLSGSTVVDAPAFKENLLGFGVCYGLTLQGLRDSRIKTNLLPREIANDRMVREKRPWAVGAAAALLLGCSFSFFTHWLAANSVAMEGYFDPAVNKAKSVASTASTYRSEFDTAKNSYGKTAQIGEGFIQNVTGRDAWLKVMKGIGLCLPRNEGERPANIVERNELNIDEFTCVYKDDLSTWYGEVKAKDKPWREYLSTGIGIAPPAANASPPPADANAPPGGAAANGTPATLPAANGTPATPPAAPPANVGTPPQQPGANAPPPATPPNAPGALNAPTATDGAPPDGAQTAAAAPAAPREPPKGPGWVFQLKGHHFHNRKNQFGAMFVAETFLKAMQQDEVPLDETWPGGPKTFPLRKLGLGFPVLLTDELVNWKNEIPVDADEEPAPDEEGKDDGEPAKKKPPKRNQRGPGIGIMGPGAMGDDQAPMEMMSAPRYDFIIQFCWQIPTPETMVELAHLYPGDVPEVSAEAKETDAIETTEKAAADDNDATTDPPEGAAPADDAQRDAASPPPTDAKKPDDSADPAAADDNKE